VDVPAVPLALEAGVGLPQGASRGLIGTGSSRKWSDRHDQETTTMATQKRVKQAQRMVDVLVIDSDDRPVLLGEVKDQVGPPLEAYSKIMDFLDATDLLVPFVLIVDPKRISIYRGDEAEQTKPVFSAKTVSVLGCYSDYYRERKGRVGKELVLTLVKAWLGDLSYQRKSKSSPPPGTEALGEIGLLPFLKNSTLDSEVCLGGYRICRD
jgi:hypothetical protein